MRRILLLATLMLLAGTWAVGQGITTSAMNGVVTDSNGDPLPGASVVAVHKPTGTTYGASTNNQGRFYFSNMKAGGPYGLTISFIGYATLEHPEFNLSLGENKYLTVKLTEDTQTLQEILVSATKDDLFSAGRTGAATNIGTTQLQRMPTLNRNLNDFTRLTPQSNGGSFGGRDNRFNNLTIDGAVNNDVFGLAPTPGGQTNTQPISLDAIQEIQVNLAPYDIRQGSFTGAGINAITRSGTNDIQGSAYFLTRNESFAGEKVRDVKVPNTEFSQSTYGLRIGGPIIKNKLFYFLNAEQEARTAPPVSFRAARVGETPGGNISRVTQADAEAFAKHLIDNYEFDPGPYEGYSFDQKSGKVFVRLDYSINSNHRLTFRHNYVKAFRDIPVSNSGSQGGRQNSATALPFKSANYTQNNTTNSTVLELNSTFGTKFSNNLILTRTTVRDFRESQTGTRPFPIIDIESAGTTYMSAGFEPFSPNNRLDQDLYQITNNFNVYAGSHVYTIGTHNEFYKFLNGFTPRFYGNYIYSSLSNFINDNAPREYQLTFSKLPNQAIPFAEFSAYQLGFYVQDEWQINDRFKLTSGLRIDIPRVYKNNSPRNAVVEESFGLRTDEMPAAKVLWSPRVGFNWDVNGDATTQVRGGVGLFTGRPPFVWLSNQVGNNGVTTGFLQLTGDNVASIRFNENQPQFQLNSEGQLVDTNGVPVPGVSSTSNISITSPDFKFPQIFRANLAVDKKLPGDVTLTLEALFSKDINAIVYKDLNLSAPVGRRDGDNREVFSTSTNVGGRRVDVRFTDVTLLDNTSRAYQYNLTAQARKFFKMGIDVMAAYNYGIARDLTSASSSIARSSYTANSVIGDPNQLILAASDNQLKHRIIGSISYFKEYLEHFGTSVSFFYTARSGFNYSYTYAGDLNNDGIAGNDLIYIPRTQNEIVLVPSNANDTRTADQIWQQLNTYIVNDPYLSSRKGQFAERNGAVTPWSFILDFSLRQDFYLMINGKKNTLQLTFDVFNFGNMLNSDWGVVQNPRRTQLLNFRGSVDGTATGRPVFSFDNLPSTFQDNLNPFVSKWEAQIGVRYIFN
jgi:hypothetical protein